MKSHKVVITHLGIGIGSQITPQVVAMKLF